MIGEEENFKIQVLGFGELAQMYLPHIKSKSASARLSSWINRNEDLKSQLFKFGYRKGSKILTPQMVEIIIGQLGTPG